MRSCNLFIKASIYDNAISSGKIANMQRELGVPESKIAFHYLNEGFSATRIYDHLHTTVDIYDFVKSRNISIGSIDRPVPELSSSIPDTACFANVMDEASVYKLDIHSQLGVYEKTTFDLLKVVFTDRQTKTSSNATYGSDGMITSFATSSRMEYSPFGLLTKEVDWPPTFIMEFMEAARWYITTHEEPNPYKIDQSDAIKIPQGWGKDLGFNMQKQYIASLPPDLEGGPCSPVFLESSNQMLIVTIERPDSTTKEVSVPIRINNLDQYGLQHAVPKAFLDLPYHNFKNRILGLIEPIGNG